MFHRNFALYTKFRSAWSLCLVACVIQNIVAKAQVMHCLLCFALLSFLAVCADSLHHRVGFRVYEIYMDEDDNGNWLMMVRFTVLFARVVRFMESPIESVGKYASPRHSANVLARFPALLLLFSTICTLESLA